jgi:hypothetical protein
MKGICVHFLFLQYTPEGSEIEPENSTLFPYTYANVACRMYTYVTGELFDSDYVAFRVHNLKLLQMFAHTGRK